MVSSYPMWICEDNYNGLVFIYQITDDLYLVEDYAPNGIFRIKKKFLTYEDMENVLHNEYHILVYNAAKTKDKVEDFIKNFNRVTEDPSTSEDSEDPISE